MKVDIKGNEIVYDGRKDSLLLSYAIQNCANEKDFRNKVDDQLLEFIALVPEMGPEHLVIVRWHAGYELGHLWIIMGLVR